MKDILKKELESKKSNVKTIIVSDTGMVPAIEMPLHPAELLPKPNPDMPQTTMAMATAKPFDETPVFSNQ
jgi:hypothetical protein